LKVIFIIEDKVATIVLIALKAYSIVEEKKVSERIKLHRKTRLLSGWWIIIRRHFSFSTIYAAENIFHERI